MKINVAEYVDEEQYGFRKRKGKINVNFMVTTIMEKIIEKQKFIYMCFVIF